jgi:hypothetical protein
MKNFIVGTVFGIVVATIGFTGVAKLLDRAVDKTKATATELSK